MSTPEKGLSSTDLYEAERASRVMPQDIKEAGLYTWRMKTIPVRDPNLSVEFLTCVTDVKPRDNGDYAVSFIFYPHVDSEIAISSKRFSPDGYTTLDDNGRSIEMGYFVESEVDPADVSAATLVKTAEDLLSI